MEIKMVENKKVLIDEQAQNQRYVYRFFKRTLDIVASVIGLIVFPVFLIVSLASRPRIGDQSFIHR
jgi:lipopolysaccharide/colanic/teichoic acid biosynthesis glycosyltransferase